MLVSAKEKKFKEESDKVRKEKLLQKKNPVKGINTELMESYFQLTIRNQFSQQKWNQNLNKVHN